MLKTVVERPKDRVEGFSWWGEPKDGKEKSEVAELSCKRQNLLALGKVRLIVRRRVFKFQV